MPSLAELMREQVDADIFAQLGEIAVFDSHEIRGVFQRTYREVEFPNGAVAGLELSFDCQYTDVIGELSENDEIEIFGENVQGTRRSLGRYRFLRELIPGGDESGLTILELGTIK